MALTSVISDSVVGSVVRDITVSHDSCLGDHWYCKGQFNKGDYSESIGLAGVVGDIMLSYRICQCKQ